MRRAGLHHRPLRLQLVVALRACTSGAGESIRSAAAGVAGGRAQLLAVRRAVPDHEPAAQVLQRPLPLPRVRGAREGGAAGRSRAGVRERAGCLSRRFTQPGRVAGAGCLPVWLACARGLRLRRPHRAPRAPPASSGTSTATTCCRCGSPTWTSPRRRRWSRRSQARAAHGVFGYSLGAGVADRGDRRPPRAALRLAHRARLDRLAAERRARAQPGLRGVRRARRGGADRHAGLPAVPRGARAARPAAGHRAGRPRRRALGAAARGDGGGGHARHPRAALLPPAQPARPRVAAGRGRGGRWTSAAATTSCSSATRSTATSSSTTSRTCPPRSPARTTRTASSRSCRRARRSTCPA